MKIVRTQNRYCFHILAKCFGVKVAVFWGLLIVLNSPASWDAVPCSGEFQTLNTLASDNVEGILRHSGQPEAKAFAGSSATRGKSGHHRAAFPAKAGALLRRRRLVSQKTNRLRLVLR